jgi:hypothetical protein
MSIPCHSNHLKTFSTIKSSKIGSKARNKRFSGGGMMLTVEVDELIRAFSVKVQGRQKSFIAGRIKDPASSRTSVWNSD